MVGKPASKGQRIGAYFIDQLVVDFVILTPIILSTGIPPTETAIKFILPTILAMSFVYWASFEKMLGQSPGKMFFGIRTIGEGSRLTSIQAGLRSITKPFTGILIVDCLPLFFGREQRITEIITKTQVIGWKN